jgi:hypothetical protein
MAEKKLILTCGLPEADLDLALSRSERPNLLRSLINTSLKTFGYFPKHYPDTISYPWIAEQLKQLPAGAHILDIGAGVSPLPVWLAMEGYVVNTVDGHPITRTLPATDDWTGWGFFDYNRVHKNITSHHCPIERFESPLSFDAIYSACALMCLTTQARNSVLRNCRKWLHSCGRLVLTISIIPSSDFLWDRKEGRDVEPLLEHGTIDDLVEQLRALDYQVRELRVLRAIKDSRTDVLFVDAVKS